jgi:stearoyl-CoA desaturase (delta-9 desaturase)
MNIRDMNGQFWTIKLPFYLLSVVSLFLYLDINWAIVSVLWFLITVLGVNITMHRYISHRSFEFKNKFIKGLCLYLGSVSIQAPPSFWALQHGHHHIHTDTLEDIHSPLHGFWKCFFTWQWGNDILKIKLTNGSIYRKFLRDNLSVWFDKHYTLLIWTTFVLLSVISPYIGLAFVLASTLSSIQIGLVNFFCHRTPGGFGASNNMMLKYLLFGEGLHKNHHDRPGDFDFSDAKNIDLSGKLIDLFKKT